MPKRDPHRDAHLEWIGFVRPTGLVVSAPALVRAGAILPRDPEGQRLLRACVTERRFHPEREPEPWLPDFRAFASSVLGWNFSPKGYAGTAEYPIPPELETPLQEAGRCCVPTLRCASAIPGITRPRGSSSSRSSSLATTSTALPAAPAAWRCRPTAGWNGCCGRPVYRQVCCATAARSASSRRRAAKAPAGSTYTWPTWSPRRAGRSWLRCGCC